MKAFILVLSYSGIDAGNTFSPEVKMGRRSSFDHLLPLSPELLARISVSALPRPRTPSSTPTRDPSTALGGRGVSGPSQEINQLESVIKELCRLQESRHTSPASSSTLSPLDTVTSPFSSKPAADIVMVSDTKKAESDPLLNMAALLGPGGPLGSEPEEVGLDHLLQQVHRLQSLLNDDPYQNPEERLESAPWDDHRPHQLLIEEAQSPLKEEGPVSGTRAQLIEVLGKLGSGSALSVLSPGVVDSSAPEVSEEDAVWEDFQVYCTIHS